MRASSPSSLTSAKSPGLPTLLAVDKHAKFLTEQLQRAVRDVSVVLVFALLFSIFTHAPGLHRTLNSAEVALSRNLRLPPSPALLLALIRSREIERSVVDPVEQIGESNARYRHRGVDNLRISNASLFDRRHYIGWSRSAGREQV
jgi:hypothetical protein